ncbi:MAG: domain containing protein [Myxococcaceae bacterium]|nr:domain containing protein [Myxococcaceae bacterium]
MSGRDFSADRRLVLISAMAVGVGALGAVLARALLALIALFTNLFYFHEASFAARSPAQSHLGVAAALAPAVGGLLIGLMARYGSERIRGHGIPEAMEAILIGRSRMQPKVALLKPLSSAISIGSGGPFGAEGPIIMTAGAAGSILAQAFHLTSNERKTLLVAGAAAGMSATFSTPLAAVLLAVELLLFELKPRSLVPVAVASATAVMLRAVLLGPGPLFPAHAHAVLPVSAYGSALVVGLSGGLLAAALTAAVYAAEDAFQRVPLHWMWWPALGGLVVGLGGLLQPRALGVGYDVLGELLAGHFVATALVGLIVVKAIIWAVALGSGTSGGVLAPLLMMGGAMGALWSLALPGGDAPLWALVGMAAVLGGAMRSPLTGVAFALELTHDANALPALLVAAAAAHGLTVLVMKRSILTEKVARRGHHVSREYSVDPLEVVMVGDVMSAPPITLAASARVADLAVAGGALTHHGYPVVDADGALRGMVPRAALLDHWLAPRGADPAADAMTCAELADPRALVAYAGESCREVAARMGQANVGRLPVLAAEAPHRLVGVVALSDLLKARARGADEDERRERFFGANSAEGAATRRDCREPIPR